MTGYWPYATADGTAPVPVPGRDLPAPPVTGPVTGPVTEAVTDPVTDPVTGPVTEAVTDPVTGGDLEEEEPGPWDLGWTGTGQWDEVPPDEPEPPLAGPALRWLASLLRESELLGGGPGGLLGELADPHPETIRAHRRHVTTHPARPAAPATAAAFTTGHLAVTFPVKATGKALTLAGLVLTAAGTRLDWLGDRFTRVMSVAVIITLLTFLAFSLT
jgi:hypothetical protein